MYIVYVLESKKDKSWYIGWTKKLKRRLKEHNCGKSVYTNKKKPWKIIYIEGYLNINDAKGREIYLKSGAGRTRLKEQIKSYLLNRF